MGRAVAAQGVEVWRHWKAGRTVRIEGDRRILVDRRGSRRDMVNGILQLFEVDWEIRDWRFGG